ncbi:CDP-diacylglycerol--serine O-phosphatidyltransferase [Reyranella sp.]|uniref:CDP-diacylglycerol--serine O-phosphatidyltransferase n=1 Tax=Reyranella sp. TaxID=1929291 RepID=UPI003BA88B37
MDSDLRSQRSGLRGFSIHRLIPNVLTLAALCSGLTGIRFALQGEMRLAVIAIIVAAIFDALDGRVARRLGVTSRFGAELDSLSDFLCFGVAPALVLYLASLTHAGALGWVVTLMFPICSALRLARFNTALVSDTPPPVWTGSFFTGVPAPAGALLALMPLMLSFEIEAAWPRHAVLVGLGLVVVGGLMVSRLPTFSFKKGRVPRHLVLPLLLGAGLFMGVLASAPWIALSLLGLAYICLIPFSVLSYRRQAAQDRQTAESAGTVPLRSADMGPAPPRD